MKNRRTAVRTQRQCQHFMIFRVFEVPWMSRKQQVSLFDVFSQHSTAGLRVRFGWFGSGGSGLGASHLNVFREQFLNKTNPDQTVTKIQHTASAARRNSGGNTESKTRLLFLELSRTPRDQQTGCSCVHTGAPVWCRVPLWRVSGLVVLIKVQWGLDVRQLHFWHGAAARPRVPVEEVTATWSNRSKTGLVSLNNQVFMADRNSWSVSDVCWVMKP